MLLAEGVSLRAICEMPGLPSKPFVLEWLAAEPEFATQYARAREEQADTLADEILEIADDARNDWMEVHGKDDEGWRENGEHIQRSKLRVDARKWVASKLRPKKYGDAMTHKGDPENPLVPPAIIVPRKELPGASAAARDPVAAEPTAG